MKIAKRTKKFNARHLDGALKTRKTMKAKRAKALRRARSDASDAKDEGTCECLVIWFSERARQKNGGKRREGERVRAIA